MMRVTIAFFLIVAGLCGSFGPAFAADSPEASVVFIEVGYMEGSVFMKIEEGTGFVVHPAGWVVTAKHVAEAVMPPGKIRYFRGAVRSRAATPIQLFDVPAPVVSADFALLRFSPLMPPNWSYLKVKTGHSFKNLDKVTAYGFPNGQELAVKPGEISQLLGPRGTIGLNVGLAPGMSGGPVILSNTRCVIGIVAGGGGAPTFDYFSPVQYAKPLLEVPPAEFVTDIATSGGAANTSQPPLFDRSYQIDETRDEHTEAKSSKDYNYDFAADPGAKIVSARYAETSANGASDKVLNISPDHTHVSFKVRLESGPFYDRWRGWWHGQIILTQQRDSDQNQAKAGCD